MRFIKLSATIFCIGLFLTACNTKRTDAIIDPASVENASWARENLDLRRVGSLLEKANDAAEFEQLLNSGEGVDNLDLNGDGYADYISVRESEDRYDDQRGYSLFSRFGPDEIQEIATIIFDRVARDRRGARVLVAGNEQIYGDNYYYETDWRDRDVPIVNWTFNDRDGYYNSPYYYQNYPNNYEAYRVVETPAYVSRIERNYPAPVFIQVERPTIDVIKIKSPYNGRSLNKIFARLAKPTREQVEFRKSNPKPPELVQIQKNKGKDERTDNDGKDKKDKQGEPGKPENPGKPEKVEKGHGGPPDGDKGHGKPENKGKPDGGGKNGKGGGKKG